METVPLEHAKEELKQLIIKATKENRQFRITSGVGSVVMLPEDTYENLLITLELLSTPGLIEGLEEIQATEEACM